MGIQTLSAHSGGIAAVVVESEVIHMVTNNFRWLLMIMY